MSDIELTGDVLLDSFAEEVEKSYNATVLDKWCEQEDESGQVWLCFTMKDKIGIVKIPIEVGGVDEGN